MSEQPFQQSEPVGRAGPVRRQRLATHAPRHPAQHERGDDDVVERTDPGQELAHRQIEIAAGLFVVAMGVLIYLNAFARMASLFTFVL